MPQASWESLERRVLLTAFVVNTLSDSAADATGTANGKVSLREALIAANTNAAFGDAAAGQDSGDSITFARSLAGKTLTLANGQLVVTGSVSISGDLTIDGNDASRLFKMTAAGDVLLQGLTLTNGHDTSASGGGAIYTAGTTLRIERGVIEGNAADRSGGGIEAVSGRVALYRTVVRGNSAGAAASTGTATPESTYIALGDSITYGETDLRYLPSYGKVNGYPALVAAGVTDPTAGRPNLINLAIDGETADSFMDDTGRTPPVVGRTDVPLQLQNKNYSASALVSQQDKFLATVASQRRAGHDIKYVSITLGFNELAALATVPNGASMIDATLATYRANYTRVLNTITRAAPGAQLVLLNYYNPFPADVNANPARSIFAAAGPRLNAIIQGLAAQYGAAYVDTATPFVGHEAAYTYIDEVGAGERTPAPYSSSDHGLAPIGNVHPNEVGYGVIARQALATLAAALPTGTAGEGGGIHAGGPARVTLTRSQVLANTATTDGGGVWASGRALTRVIGTAITDNVASGTSAADGGGGLFSTGTLSVSDTRITGNVANGRRGSGGGVFLGTGGTTSFSDVRVSGNRAFYRGGGLYNDGDFTATTTDVFYNRARTSGGLFTDAGAVSQLNTTSSVRLNLPDDGTNDDTGAAMA